MPQSSHGATAMPSPFSFISSTGQALARRLLAPIVPFDIHDYQVEGTCTALHGQDLLACIPTGGGKTAYLFLPLLLIQAVHDDPSVPMHVKRKFPRFPAMIAIFPTNNLELEKEKEFERFGLNALAINSLTLEKARKSGKNLWQEARYASIVILSPEQLISRAFEGLIQDPAFAMRVLLFGVDEIQLLDIWGASFRKAFQQIGFIRARLPERVVLIALTATLLAGERHRNVCRFLGLKSGQYHTIRRSNMRYDIQLLVRSLTAGLGNWKFPDLDWVLGRGRKTIIFCKTILLGFRVMVYLWRRALPSPDRSIRIRSYNSLNSAIYNTHTQELMLAPASPLQIIIATDTLSQGVNAPDICDVITMGEPTDPDEFFQRIGRAGRDSSLVSDARGIMYVPASSFKAARTLLGPGAHTTDRSQSHGQKKQHDIHPGVARLLLAPCLRKEQDLLYDNPLSDPPCTCQSCTNRPPLSLPVPCNCSGCIADLGDTMTPEPHFSPTQFFMEDPSKPKPKRLSPANAKVAKDRLIDLRREVWRAANEVSLVPPQLYLPDKTITALLDHLTTFRTPSDLDVYINANPYIQDKRDRLWAVICDIRQSLAPNVVQPSSDAQCFPAEELCTAGGDLRMPEASTSSTTVSTGQHLQASACPSTDIASVRRPRPRPRPVRKATVVPQVTVEVPDEPDPETGRSGIVIRIRRPAMLHSLQPLSPSKRKRNELEMTEATMDDSSSMHANKRNRILEVKENVPDGAV